MGLVGLGMNLETMVNLRPTGASVGWRATGSIEQVRCQRACKEPEADLRVESAARRWVPSAIVFTRLASSSSWMTLMRFSTGMLTFSLASAAARENI